MADKKISFETEKNLAAAALAIGGAAGAPSRILGYHNVYHGTKIPHGKIHKEGLRPSYGGTGASASPDNGDYAKTYQARSSGRIHVTKSKFFAAMYGNPIKARVSDAHWRSMKEDITHKMGKDHAATTNHAIPPRQIKGGDGYKGIRSVVTKNTLRKYYSSKAGIKRGLSGLAMAATSALASKYLYNKAKAKLSK